MPPESTWSQYPVVAILVLATGVIGFAFYRLWKDLLAWYEQQETKRTADRVAQDAERAKEREKQREWQAEQDKIRDLRWQEFLKSMQDEWTQQDGRHTAALKELITQVGQLIITVNSHDTWARAKDAK